MAKQQPQLDFGDRIEAKQKFGDLHEEIVVDNFAGGGGASLGIEDALGFAVDIAINHDRKAVGLHVLNHPATRHYCENVWQVDPGKATKGRPVGLAWFSPDCKDFSRAKGGKPVSKKIRGLAWVVIRWARKVKPRVIILENVREFAEWGPLVPRWACSSCKWRGSEGQAVLARTVRRCPRCNSSILKTDDEVRDPEKKGLTFKKWVGCLRNLGYAVEWKTLNAADYGAPTHRRRLFLIARCDGKPIVWPEPSHGPTRALPWRTAAECIDWSIPCHSIFLSKEEGDRLNIRRPLKPKTMRRIAMGMKRYVIDCPKPYIVRCNHSDICFRGQSIDDPMATVTGSRDAHGLVMQTVAPILTQRNGEAPHQESRSMPVDRPLGTVTPREGGGFNLTGAYLAQIGNYGGNGNYCGSVENPLGTIVSKAQDLLVAPILSEYHDEKSPGDLRAKGLGVPLPTQTSENRFALVAAFINQHFGGERNPPVGKPLEDPLPTVTAVDHNSLTAASLMKFRGDSAGTALDQPMPTVTAGGDCQRDAGAAHAMGIQVANLVHFNHGEKQWNSLEEPMRTVCTGGNHAAVVAFLAKYNRTGVGALPNEPLRTVTNQDRFAVVQAAIDGMYYAIADIGMRMLVPRELARAQGFPDSYVLRGPKSLQVRMIGNSVSPVMGKVLVAANYRSKRISRRRREAITA